MKQKFFSFCKKLQSYRTLFLFSLPVVITVTLALVVSQHSLVQDAYTVQPKQEVISVHISISPTPTFTPTPTASEQIVVTSTPTVSKQASSIPTQQTKSLSSNNPTETPTSVAQSQQTTVTPIPTVTITPTAQPIVTPTNVAQTVSVQIQTPDGNSNFSIDLANGMNVCDVLTKAKSEGKIQSLTLSDAYMNTLHSLYVVEMNGFNNNWTFTVNGSSPLGCSLSIPKPNDTIVWKFG